MKLTTAPSSLVLSCSAHCEHEREGAKANQVLRGWEPSSAGPETARLTIQEAQSAEPLSKRVREGGQAGAHKQSSRAGATSVSRFVSQLCSRFEGLRGWGEAPSPEALGLEAALFALIEMQRKLEFTSFFTLLSSGF